MKGLWVNSNLPSDITKSDLPLLPKIIPFDHNLFLDQIWNISMNLSANIDLIYLWQRHQYEKNVCFEWAFVIGVMIYYVPYSPHTNVFYCLNQVLSILELYL